MFQENSIETCILSRVKEITSPGWMHETSARTWCTGKTWRERVEREVRGRIWMGNTCKPMAVSFQCMTKSTTIIIIIKKEWSPDTCYNTQEPQKDGSQWKEPDAKSHVVHDYIYVNHPEQINPKAESRWVVAKGWAGVGKAWEVAANQCGDIFMEEGAGNVLKLIVMMVTQLY